MHENHQYREYKTDALIIYWNAGQCSHSGKCWALLPKVFSPDKRPWVCPDGAEPLEIIKTIDQCPTGALRYQLAEGSRINPELAKGPGWIGYKAEPASVQIRMVKDGPLLVKGPAKITDTDGNMIQECDSMVLCRCGKTKNPPFCDGSHKNRE
jgi:uncharacterized Fe-S cluster protein YjdI